MPFSPWNSFCRTGLPDSTAEILGINAYHIQVKLWQTRWLVTSWLAHLWLKADLSVSDWTLQQLVPLWCAASAKWQQLLWRNSLNRKEIHGIATVTHVPFWAGEGLHFGRGWRGTSQQLEHSCGVDGKALCSKSLESNLEAWTSLPSILELLFSLQDN